jgi:ATPase subunit of ABC transporter with duplicated ATPase domains
LVATCQYKVVDPAPSRWARRRIVSPPSYEIAPAGNQPFQTLSGGQQARLQILLLELAGATLLLLDEPTDNLDLPSADALQQGLDGFAGTVITVTHDRWFATSADRYLIFGADGHVYETNQPVWDERRVQRTR